MTTPSDMQMLITRARADAAEWLERMRVPGQPLGYFRFSEHAYHPWCLYASNAALAIYTALGLVETLSAEEKQGWADIFMRHYHPELGLFLCPVLYGDRFAGDPRNREDRRRADAAAPFKKIADKVHSLIGFMPAAPDEGTLGFRTTAELGAFLDGKRNELEPYGFGSTLGEFFHLRSMWLQGQGLSVHDDPWIAWGYEYLAGVLDPDTAMISGVGNDPWAQMNGQFKLACSTYWRHLRPMPRGRDIINRILSLATMAHGFGRDCNDYNATLLLCRLSIQENGYRREEILRTLEATVLPRLMTRRQADGGFSFQAEHCLTQVNMYRVSDPLPEGDLFGTGQQLAILEAMKKLADSAMPPVSPP